MAIMIEETSIHECADGPAVLGAANALADQPAPGQWLKLADYGDWPHPSGLQRFTPASAATMVRGFQSLWGRLRRRFGGVPLYVGHPDDPAFSGQAGHDDTRAYGWVTALDARDDGLYIFPRWSEPGREMLQQAFYKFLSPRWQMRPLGDGTFEPVRLLSIGLTNNPNIPGEAIANQRTAVDTPLSDAATQERILPKLLAALAMEANASPEALLANAEQLAQMASDARSAQTEAARFYRLATDADTARQTAEKRAEEERSARVELMLDLAELRGCIPPATRTSWREQLHTDFNGARLALANAKPISTNDSSTRLSGLPPAGAAPLTSQLAMRRQGATRQADGERLLALVNERIARTGEDYATAFARAKRDHAELFQA